MAFFIGIVCPWILIVFLDRIAEGRRADELKALGFTAPATPAHSSYLTPDRPY